MGAAEDRWIGPAHLLSRQIRVARDRPRRSRRRAARARRWDARAGRELLAAVDLGAVDADQHRVGVEAVLECDVDLHAAAPAASTLVLSGVEYKRTLAPDAGLAYKSHQGHAAVPE